MMKPACLAAVLALSLMPLGCRRDAGPKEAPKAPAPATASVSEERSRPFGAQLAAEAADAPAVERTQAALAHLAKAGVVLDRPRQALARTVRARFCMSGTTRSGLAVSACDYGTDAQARAGREYSLATFKHFSNRQIVQSGPMTLTVSALHGKTAEHPEAQRAIAAFETSPLAAVQAR